jgi:hypothetical protein
MSKLDNIKTLYEKIQDKKDFWEKVAEEFGLRKSSIRTNWITRFEIPEKYGIQERLIAFMQNYISLQTEKEPVNE